MSVTLQWNGTNFEEIGSRLSELGVKSRVDGLTRSIRVKDTTGDFHVPMWSWVVAGADGVGVISNVDFRKMVQ